MSSTPVFPAAPQGADVLYASVDGAAYALGGEEVVFQPKSTPESHVMTPQVLAALDLSRPFRTLHQHVGEIGKRDPRLAGQFDATLRVMRHLVARGLMVSAEQYVASLGSAPLAEPAPLKSIYIRAHERPRELARLLAALAEQERRTGRRHRYVVVDRSRDAGAQRANADALQAAGTLDRVHVDIARWTRALARLAKARPEAKAAIDDALDPTGLDSAAPGYGKGFNLITLLGAGTRYGMLDEDFVVPLALPTDYDGRLALERSGDLPTHFFTDTASALAHGVPYDGDPFDRHAAWCGRPLAAVLRDGGLAMPPADLAGFAPSLHPELGAATRVLMTMTGQRGDAVTASGNWMYFVDGASRERLASDRARYLRYVESGAAWRSPLRPTLLGYAHITPLLVDGSGLLPPTLPQGRGEDLLFGVLASILQPAGVVLYDAATLGHVREPGRPVLHGRADTPHLGRYIVDWLQTRARDIRAESPVHRLEQVAMMLDDLAHAPERDRIDLLHEYRRFRNAESIERLNQELHATPTPPIHWQADVRRLIEANGKALLDSSAPRLGDWPEGLDAAGCAQRLSRDLGSYATLLRHWPALWQTASDLGDRLVAD